MEELKLKKTRMAFLWTQILGAPFWAIYNLLLFILYKDLGATPFQIGLFIALKPTVSLISIYWSDHIHCRPDRLVKNVVWAGIIGFCPFLIFPWYASASFVLFASALYMTMLRGVIPAWMEIFKLNLPGETKQKVFSLGSIVSYAVGAIFPVLIGPLLDMYSFAWRPIFCIAALLGMISVFFQLRIPIDLKKRILPTPWTFSLVEPWKKAFKLLREKKNFRLYQFGFMVLGGSGLMVMQPALPKFFIDVLGLSYTELSIALTLCKGVGFAMTSRLWASALGRYNFFRLSALVAFLGAIFPLLLLLGKLNLSWIYIAYLSYGIMQAGSELVWHLSGPHFAHEEESSSYSSVNVLAVGVRGSVIPQLGSMCSLFLTSPFILLIGALSSFSGGISLYLSSRKLEPTVSRSGDQRT